MRRIASRSCLAVLLVFVAWSGACSDDVGDDPASPGDASSADGRGGGGVDASHDAQVGTDARAADADRPDANGLDATVHDASAEDTGADVAVPDASLPDASVTDSGARDASPPLDATPPDGGAPDASVPDASAPDATVPDASTPDAGFDAGSHDGGPPDAGAPDAGGVDAGHLDAGPPDASAPDAGPTGGECTGYNGGTPCTPTEQRFVSKSLECYKCMVNSGCLDDALFNDTGHECGDVTGAAAHGAKAGASRTSLCLATLDCILDTRNLCAADDVNLCYCGSLGAGNGCATATSGADGKCFQQEVDGLEHLASDPPSAVLPDYNSLALGAGIANQLFVCAKSNACDELCAK